MYYSNNNSRPTSDDEPDKQTVAIVLAVSVVGMVLLRLLCFCIQKDREEQYARGGHRARQSSHDGDLVDMAPSMTAVDAGGAVEMAPVRAAEPPLVCTYWKEDGWGESSCGVCLADFTDGETLRVLPACLHYFHAACVGEWLRGHDTSLPALPCAARPSWPCRSLVMSFICLTWWQPT